MAWPSPAYLGLAWPGSQPEAGPGTALRVQYADVQNFRGKLIFVIPV
jgi:hypothetical protein